MNSTSRNITPLWEIGSLPFVLGALNSPHNLTGLTDSLPFVLGVDPRTGLISQGPNAAVDGALEKAYRTADAMPSNFDESGIGRVYADDFLAFVAAEVSDLSGLRVLEIGSGGGYLLACLRDRGASVLGIEPGAHGQDGAREYGVEIVHDFFPSPRVTGRFDMIVLTNVLEHLEDPVAFLRGLPQQLEPMGRIIIGVPDERAYITSGDVSTLFHEHWSYFDSRTLANTACLAGLAIERMESASFGGSLYATMVPAGGPRELSEVDEAVQLAHTYAQTAKTNCAILKDFVETETRDGRVLGVFVPSRFVNVARIGELNLGSLRFFDDDEGAHGRFYPGFNVPIESRAALLTNPTDSVLIMSQTFGPRLAKELSAALPGVRVRAVAEVLPASIAN